MTNIQRLAAQHLERLAQSQQRRPPPDRPPPSARPAPPSRPPPLRAEAKHDDVEVNDTAEEKEISESKLTTQSDSEEEYERDSDEDTTYSEPLLALDIGAINGETEEKNGENGDDEAGNDASFRVNDSFIKIAGGFEIHRDGIQRTPKMSSSEANVFRGVKASGGVGGGGGAKDLMVPLGVLGKGASGVVRKALHVPALILVAQKVIPVFEEERRHQMVRELKALYRNLVSLSATPGEERGGGKGPCPHIVSMYEAYMDRKASSVTLVVEYMDGGSLQEIVDTGGCDAEPGENKYYASVEKR